MASFPAPACIVSFPIPPSIESEPAPPIRRSLLSLPIRLSSPEPPTTKASPSDALASPPTAIENTSELASITPSPFRSISNELNGDAA